MGPWHPPPPPLAPSVVIGPVVFERLHVGIYETKDIENMNVTERTSRWMSVINLKIDRNGNIRDN